MNGISMSPGLLAAQNSAQAGATAQYLHNGEHQVVELSAVSVWKVRPVRSDEFDPWARLFQGYADFYHRPTSAEHQRTIWRWIHDDGSVEALVAVPIDEAGNESGEPQGLAHLRQWVRPLLGVVCGYLDDLFVEPVSRGSGVVDALFAEINRIALDRDWAMVRWTTADDNYRARSVYDQVATRTTWITYDMTPQPSQLRVETQPT